MKKLLLALVFTLGGWTAATTHASAQTYAQLGCFVGGIDRSDFAANYTAFQTSVGQGATSMPVFVDYTQPITNWVANAAYSAGPFFTKQPTVIPIVSVGLCDNAHGYTSGVYNETGANAMMNAIAAGTYDSVFTGVVTAYKTAGFTKIYLRIGWEQDLVPPNPGSSNPWYATPDTTASAAYIAAWQRVATLAHAVSGITVKTVWSPGEDAYSALDVGTYSYPGDAYADVIAPDLYSNGIPRSLLNWADYTAEPSWAVWQKNAISREHFWDYPNGTSASVQGTVGWGVIQGIAFAKAHGKPFGLTETGAGISADGTSGLQDDADFPFYLGARLSSCLEQGVPVEFVDIWDAGNYNFSTGTKPHEEVAWRQFVVTMAAATSASVPFGVNYAIGTVGAAGGGTGTLPANVTVQGGGTGYLTSGMSDNFNFVAQPIKADGSFVMQLPSAPTITAGQVGVMLRGGMGVSAPYAAVYLTGTTCKFVTRAVTGGATVQVASVAGATYPLWLKLERDGQALVAYKSSDGQIWSYIGSQIVALPTNGYIGAAIGSGSATTINTATLSAVNSPITVIVDNTAATKTGSWVTVNGTLGYNGSYYTDNNLNKGTCSITYTPNLPAAGTYDIYAWYRPGSGDGGSPLTANNIPATLVNSSGTVPLTINEVGGFGLGWNYIATVSMVAGTGNALTITNTGTTQPVLVDAFQFVHNPAPVGATIGSVSTTPTALNLSPTGVVDWGHWGGTVSVPSTAWDRANLTTSLIGNYTAIGTGSTYGSGCGTTYSWSGSAGPNASATDGARCLYRQGTGTGFQLTVSAGTSARLLDVYVGEQWVVNSQMQVLDAANNVLYTHAASSSTSHTGLDFTFSLEANQTYKVQYTQTGGTGNVSLEAATLNDEPLVP